MNAARARLPFAGVNSATCHRRPTARRGPARARLVAMATVAGRRSLFTRPASPGCTATGRSSRSALIALVAGLVLACRAHEWSTGARASPGCARRRRDAAVRRLPARQRGLRRRLLRRRDRRHPARAATPAIIVCGGAVGGARASSLVARTRSRRRSSACCSRVLPVVPRHAPDARLARRRDEAERLVEELRESRAAHAESAALAERGRVAREHARRARPLALGAGAAARGHAAAGAATAAPTRRSSRRSSARTTSPPSGLDEARDAIGALRGDELPGPERCDLAARLPGDAATLTVTGDAARARVRGAAGALPHRPGGAHERAPPQRGRPRRAAARLRAPTARGSPSQDHGAGAAPVDPATGGGYGLTGMRERAELLGGAPAAPAPPRDGFRVELWLPA